ncbi:BRO family protein [Streptomyces sp. BI20]|uniref:BRO family protein n=1 Tax=Streptomyces sp. BI20 TaxID=3403460 RepID=UPI003C77340A
MINKIFKRNDGNDFAVRVVEQGGEPWFVAADVATILGYSRTNDAVRKHVDEEDRGTTSIRRSTSGGNPNVATVNESGLYALIFGSKLPAAKDFKRWVTGEVLPSIRKTGGYQGGDAIQAAMAQLVADPAGGLLRMAELTKRAETAEAAVEELTPLADAFHQFTDTDDTASLRDVARLVDMKERVFGTTLREWGWVEKWGTAATSKARDKGWMVNKVIQAPYGRRPVQGRVTGKGFGAIVKKLAA